MVTHTENKRSQKSHTPRLEVQNEVLTSFIQRISVLALNKSTTETCPQTQEIATIMIF